jgi:hypothetical protein
MRKQHIFRPNGWNGLEVRITPSAVGLASAAEMVRIDAHVSHAKVHHHAHRKAQHVTHPGGGTGGGGYTGSVIYVSGSGGGYTGGYTGGSGGNVDAGGGTLGSLLASLFGGGTGGGGPLGGRHRLPGPVTLGGGTGGGTGGGGGGGRGY